MIRKTKIVFSFLLASFLLVGMAGATGCVEQDYYSGWLNIIDYVDSYSGSSGIYNGDYYVDDNTGIVTIHTPDLPFAETYTLYIKIGIGTGNDLDTEDLRVICGGETFDFPDSVLTDDPQTVIKNMQCTLPAGESSIEFKSTNSGSVHLYKFKLIASKTCPPQPTCGDGNVDSGEECDLGILNGNVCNPLYGDTCTWCNNNCELITETGPFCGDEICQAGEGEDCSTCESDCGVCPPQPTCGDGNVDSGEECDLGVLNGQICDPIYGDTCTWCNNNCELITETGPFCGDEICQAGEGEDCSTCESDCGECQDDNDDDKVKKSPHVLDVCNPDWKCSGWSECSGGVMTRTCFDDNFCEIEYNKPHETTACDITEQVKEPIIDYFLWFLIGIILLILLLIILVNLIK